MSLRFQISALAFLSIMAAAPVMAQVPSTADPGRIDDRLSAPSLDRAPRAVTPTAPPSAPTTAIPDGAERVTFTLNSITMDGNTVFDQSHFQGLYNEQLGQTVSLADMINLADKITAEYRNEGYILTRAVVPEQEVKNGNIRIQVIEGFISKVNIQGEFADHGILAGYAREIEQVRPITAQALERYLLLANDIPGMTVEGILQRSPDVPGAAEMTFKTDRKIISAGARIDNRGSKYLGAMQSTFTSSINNALGLAEQLGVTYINAGEGELNYYGADASIGLNSEGTRLGVTVSSTRTQPGFDLERFNTQGESDAVSVQLSHPLIRTRGQNLSAFLRVDGRDTENRQLNVVTSEDKIRSGRLGANYQIADTWDGVNSANLLFSQGINGLGAKRSGSSNLSRTNGKSDYQKINLEIQRIQSITPLFNFVLAGSAQYAFDDLLASEQFGIGGTGFGRGYDSSELTGDNGFAGKAELQYNHLLGYQYAQVVQPYAFYDYGEVANRTTLASEKKERSLSSLGAGLRFQLTDNFSGELEVAQPLNKRLQTEGKKFPKLFFGFSARY